MRKLERLEALPPRELQQAIARDPEATRRVLEYVEEIGGSHHGRVSGSVLATVLELSSDRRWRELVTAGRMPRRHTLALVYVAWARSS